MLYYKGDRSREEFFFLDKEMTDETRTMLYFFTSYHITCHIGKPILGSTAHFDDHYLTIDELEQVSLKAANVSSGHIAILSNAQITKDHYDALSIKPVRVYDDY